MLGAPNFLETDPTATPSVATAQKSTQDAATTKRETPLLLLLIGRLDQLEKEYEKLVTQHKAIKSPEKKHELFMNAMRPLYFIKKKYNELIETIKKIETTLSQEDSLKLIEALEKADKAIVKNQTLRRIKRTIRKLYENIEKKDISEKSLSIILNYFRAESLKNSSIKLLIARTSFIIEIEKELKNAKEELETQINLIENRDNENDVNSIKEDQAEIEKKSLKISNFEETIRKYSEKLFALESSNHYVNGKELKELLKNNRKNHYSLFRRANEHQSNMQRLEAAFEDGGAYKCSMQPLNEESLKKQSEEKSPEVLINIEPAQQKTDKNPTLKKTKPKKEQSDRKRNERQISRLAYIKESDDSTASLEREASKNSNEPPLGSLQNSSAIHQSAPQNLKDNATAKQPLTTPTT